MNWQKTYLNQILSGKGQAIIDTMLYFAQCSCQEFSVYQESHMLNSIRTLMEYLLRNVMISQHPKIFGNNWNLKSVELTFVSNLLKKLLTSVQDLTSNESACLCHIELVFDRLTTVEQSASRVPTLVFTYDLHKWFKVFVRMLRQIEHKHIFKQHNCDQSASKLKKESLIVTTTGTIPLSNLGRGRRNGPKDLDKSDMEVVLQILVPKAFVSLYDANETAGVEKCVNKVIKLFEQFLAIEKESFNWSPP
ncbi:hypothetical protein RFI_34551 [Reticulomyxa filosa]|uniref:Uncharacterized protein n=1 Tax=Reticulomyxa filosa TaxID=46433 RepID=X6LP12_RETFI|nr:hypothetical protein RFI_34551 [Reticulomyxa filosa]|eukprot:ETO02862.1 hypothetical protein RFI_34551 [Reticulomyxa filosa]